MTSEEQGRQYHELQEDYAFSDTREERLHIAAEMDDILIHEITDVLTDLHLGCA